MPDEIFNRFLNVAWNKLFNRDFILKNNLQFQEIKRLNDSYFVNCAFVYAKKISFMDKIFVHYRVGERTDLQKINCKFPFEYTKVVIKIKDTLVKNGLYKILKRSYDELALGTLNRGIKYISSYPSTTISLYLYLIFYVLPKIGIPFWKIKYKYLWKSRINTIFSVKNDGDKKHKMITISGIKIKIKRKQNAKS